MVLVPRLSTMFGKICKDWLGRRDQEAYRMIVCKDLKIFEKQPLADFLRCKLLDGHHLHGEWCITERISYSQPFRSQIFDGYSAQSCGNDSDDQVL